MILPQFLNYVHYIFLISAPMMVKGLKNSLSPISVIMFVLVIVSLLSITSTAHSGEDKPIVVTSTSVLASIVKDLAGDKVRVIYIVSPSMCPGHYDVKPGDVVTISEAKLVLYHGFEPWVKELIEAVNSTGSWSGLLVKIRGSWNTPDSLKKLYIKVAEVLKDKLGIDVSARLEKCLKEIDNVAKELKNIARENGFENKPVVVMLWQKPFVKYLGFKIVATYGPPEKLSPKDISIIEDNATKYHAILVIDNMQSGTEIGSKIAQDIGAVHVVLINFPYSVPSVNNVTQMMLYNAKILAEAIHDYKFISENAKLKSEANFWKTVSMGLLVVVVVEAILIMLQAKRGRK